MSKELEARIELFREEYLQTPAGQKHLAVTESEPEEVRAVFAEIKEKHHTGKDITDDVLRRLLPIPTASFIAKMAIGSALGRASAKTSAVGSRAQAGRSPVIGHLQLVCFSKP